MVSTRGVKLKFFDGERVLCYEPDPTKAKVLYDSKVLQVVTTRDSRGRKKTEYLIHFQGWNSSWDRCVCEEYVLKDTAENRQLQKDLAEKSQLQLGAYLYRRERKKSVKSDRPQQSSEDGSSGSPATMDIEDNREDSTSSDELSSSNEEELVHFELTPNLRHCLEHDNYLINMKHKLIKIPADPNVITILEMYWKHCATSLFCDMNEKSSSRHRHPSSNSSKTKTEDIYKNLNICKEMVDGLRIYFDFVLSDLLLYKREKEQVETALPTFPLWQPRVKVEANSHAKNEGESPEYAHLPNLDFEEDTSSDGDVQTSTSRPNTRRSGLRSCRNVAETDAAGVAAAAGAAAAGAAAKDVTNGLPQQMDLVTGIKQECGVESNGSDISSPMNKILAWRLLPEEIHTQQPPPPSLIYGATHLTRLLVKLPDLLNASNMAEEKLKVLLNHLDLFLDFLNEHKEWYGDKHYVDAP